MSRAQLAQCFFFVFQRNCLQDNSSSSSAIEGYALLPDIYKANHPKVIDLFSRNDLHVISNGNFSVPPFGEEDKLIITEVLLDEAPSACLDPLSLVVEEDLKDTVRLLFQNANIQFETEQDSADVRTAVGELSLDVIKRFLTCGVNIRCVRQSAELLLHIAARRGIESLVKLALEHGADVEVRKNYSTALYVAAGNSCASVLKLLIRKGANVNAANDRGRTPIFNAAKAGQVNLIRVLVDCGARVDTRDSHHSTVLDAVCESRPHPMVFQHILDWYFFDLENLSKSSISTPSCAQPGYRDDVFVIDLEDIKIRRQHLKRYSLLFVRHLIKTIAADSDFVWSEVKTLPFWGRKIEDLGSFRNKFEAEVARMKSERIAETDLTFYDILTKGASKVACYLRNDSVAQVLTWNNLENKYPIYASILYCQVQKGLLREQLMKQGISICRALFAQFSKLPRELKEKIINYLSSQDISILKIACLPIDSDS